MMRLKKRLARLTGAGLALLVAFALSAGPLLAECQNQDGTSRACTPSENLAQCADDAVDAVNQCVEGAGGFLGGLACAFGYYADIAACGVGMAKDITFR